MPGTLKIPIFRFMRWFQQKLDQKHSPSLQTLKTLFLTFSTLVKQLITTYLTIKTELQKQEQQLWTIGETVIDTSIQILLSMTENIPVCLDLSFCENFAHQFESKLTLLCSYYHSLSHIEEESKSNIRKEKQKIVDGINMLYLVTGDIKQETKEVIHLLKMASDYKKLFGKKLSSIQAKLDLLLSSQQQDSDFETKLKKQKSWIIQFLFKNVEIQQVDQNLKKFLYQYFQMIDSASQNQVQLQNVLEEPTRICNQLKNKKKILNHMMQQPNWGSISRMLNNFLKNNFFTKQIRKIKIDEFMSFLKVISLKKDQFIESSFDFEKMENKIRQLMEATIQYLKELEKVDRIQIIEMIHSQTEKPSNQDIKKMLEEMNQYNFFAFKYFKANEEIKSLDRFVQTIVAKELKMKVRLILS